MPRTVTLTGLVVAKSGTINLKQYIDDQIYKLLSFIVISRGDQAHSHAHVSHNHVLTVEAGSDANAPVYALGLSGHKLIGSKPADSTAGAIGATTTTESGKVTVEGLQKSAKTVINSGLATSTIPSAGSVALTNATTITIANSNNDSLVGTEIVNIKYVPRTAYPIPS